MILVASLSFFPQVFSGAAFPWDFYSVSTTGPAFVSQSIGNGDWPTWTSFVGSGIPLSPFNLSSLWFPLWWVLGLLDVSLTLNMLAKIQVLFVAGGGLGMVALTRAHLFRWRWALAAGIAFLFFGGFFAQAQHAETVRGFALTPWLFWSITFPRSSPDWKRLSFLPFIIYALGTGAYPSFVTSLAQAAALYLSVELFQHRKVVTKQTLLKVFTFLLSGFLMLLGAWLAYLSQGSAGLLYRPHPPTFAVRADTAFSSIDFLGLFLDSVAIHDRVIYSWGVGIPILVGLAGVTKKHLRPNLAVIVTGFYGLFLTIAPKNAFLGNLMLGKLSPLFPGRFSAIEGKVIAAIAIIFFSLLGWQTLLSPGSRRRPAVLSLIALLSWGVWLGWDLSPTPPGILKLVVISLLATLALTELPKRLTTPRVGLLVLALIALLIADGIRSNHLDTMIHSSGQRTWVVRYAEADLEKRDHAAAILDNVLQNPPTQRPARLPPSVDLASRAHGTPRDSLGLLGLHYNAANYGGFMIKPYWQMVTDPPSLEAFLLPWTAWTIGCNESSCPSQQELSDQSSWTMTDRIQTTRYGQESIDYQVNLEHVTVFIENELNYPNWSSDDPRVRLIEHDGVFRSWMLEAGEYSFTTHYADPDLSRQISLIILGLLVWVTAIISTIRLPRWQPPTRFLASELKSKRNDIQ